MAQIRSLSEKKTMTSPSILLTSRQLTNLGNSLSVQHVKDAEGTRMRMLHSAIAARAKVRICLSLSPPIDVGPRLVHRTKTRIVTRRHMRMIRRSLVSTHHMMASVSTAVYCVLSLSAVAHETWQDQVVQIQARLC
ncbi:hypothetical protein IG631_21716 [Alternaria alternata]|nr:hypothetical protein IG631_21716 [Alternaria alternata]